MQLFLPLIPSRLHFALLPQCYTCWLMGKLLLAEFPENKPHFDNMPHAYMCKVYHGSCLSFIQVKKDKGKTGWNGYNSWGQKGDQQCFYIFEFFFTLWHLWTARVPGFIHHYTLDYTQSHSVRPVLSAQTPFWLWQRTVFFIQALCDRV